MVVNHLDSGVKDLNALGLLCFLLDPSLFHGKLVSCRPDGRIYYDNHHPGNAPQLHKAGGMSGPFATVLVAPLPSGSMEAQLNVRLKARLQQLEVADIREDVRKGCFIKLTDGEHAEMLKKPKFERLGEMPNCWGVSGRSNGTTTVNVDVLPPVKLRSAAGIEQVAAEKLGAELVGTVLEKAEAESIISAAVDKKLQPAIEELAQVLSENEACEDAGISAAVTTIKRAIAKAKKCKVPPEELDAANTRIVQLVQQKTSTKKRKRSSATVETPGGASTTPCPVADETSAHAATNQQEQEQEQEQ